MHDSVGLSPDRARDIVECFRASVVLIVGDVMLDHFVVGRVTRISPEAPVPVVEHDHDEYRIGGAGNVAANVRALGGRVELVGVVGNDPQAGLLRDQLAGHGIGDDGLVTDEGRPTTTKQRIVTSRNQQVARIDFESDEEVSGEVERRLTDTVARHMPGAHVVVVSDYLKGAITRPLMSGVVHEAHARRIPVLVDPKIPHLEYYAGVDVVTPNHHEAEVATHLRIRSEADARRAGRVFLERGRCRRVLITRGEHGMSLVDEASEAHFPAVAREVADVTGAGDTVIATFALALAAGASGPEAALLATHAAGIVVGKFGVATVTPDELLAELTGR
ncbi:MAG: D-glycero-beta-D-manno-heptose-7-phosphate kinase [Acidobacteriota bacterium]